VGKRLDGALEGFGDPHTAQRWAGNWLKIKGLERSHPGYALAVSELDDGQGKAPASASTLSVRAAVL